MNCDCKFWYANLSHYRHILITEKNGTGPTIYDYRRVFYRKAIFRQQGLICIGNSGPVGEVTVCKERDGRKSHDGVKGSRKGRIGKNDGIGLN